jgi:2-oxoglutarate ferredoxin oxidoreductase subunit beta
MIQVVTRPRALLDVPTHYCPGCTHGIIQRLIAEAIDRFDIRDRTVGVASVGCSVFAYNYFDVDFQQAAHGRAPAVATGIKRALPDRIVFTYQGDGDLASIGAAEILHAAARGERITVIYVNNGLYGMTGGQMAPTTLPGMKTTTTPVGRDVRLHGNPLRITDLLANVEGVAYAAREAVTSVAHVNKARRAVEAAFAAQIEDRGLGIVELLSTCPVNWGLGAVEAVEWCEQHMVPAYPLGVLKDTSAKAARPAALRPKEDAAKGEPLHANA